MQHSPQALLLLCHRVLSNVLLPEPSRAGWDCPLAVSIAPASVVPSPHDGLMLWQVSPRDLSKPLSPTWVPLLTFCLGATLTPPQMSMGPPEHPPDQGPKVLRCSLHPPHYLHPHSDSAAPPGAPQTSLSTHLPQNSPASCQVPLKWAAAVPQPLQTGVVMGTHCPGTKDTEHLMASCLGAPCPSDPQPDLHPSPHWVSQCHQTPPFCP